MKKKQRSRVGLFADRFFLLALSALLALIGLNTIVQQLRTVDIEETARALERGHAVPRPALLRRAGDVERFVAERTCYDPSLRAAVTLSLAEIQLSNPESDFEGWATNLEEGRTLMRQAVACSPLNANFWARLAETERTIAATPDRIIPLMEMSMRLAPAEFPVLEARFQTWPKVASWFPDRSGTPLSRDMRTVLGGASLYDVKRLVGSAPSLEKAIEEALPSLSRERQADVRRLTLNDDTIDGAADSAEPRYNLLDTPRR